MSPSHSILANAPENASQTGAAGEHELCQHQDNPLIWPLLTLLKQSVRGWKVHHLATELQQRNLMRQLDDNPDKDLFKRNFLLMNALYQLQQLLWPQQWLQVQAMDIRLYRVPPADGQLQLQRDQALRQYYLDWQNYDTCANVVKQMLASFWQSYQAYIGVKPQGLAYRQALQAMELEPGCSASDIRRRWRKLALRWHPDRQGGDAEKFREVCEAWQILREP
ncbi:DNA-J related domain-containing protein [Shewanella sp. YIC-542]|uniref:DNA-J related domain-containing protein n=1 Tax=Shewanella mytili TaxID=3377111 RepID=UPI00398F279F